MQTQLDKQTVRLFYVVAVYYTLKILMSIYRTYELSYPLAYMPLSYWFMVFTWLVMVCLCTATARKLHRGEPISSKQIFVLQVVVGILISFIISSIWYFIKYSGDFTDINSGDFTDIISFFVFLGLDIAATLGSVVLMLRVMALFPPKMRVHWIKITGGTALLVSVIEILLAALGIQSLPPEFVFFGIALCIGFAILAYFAPQTAGVLLSFTVQAVGMLTRLIMGFCVVAGAIVAGIMNRR